MLTTRLLSLWTEKMTYTVEGQSQKILDWKNQTSPAVTITINNSISLSLNFRICEIGVVIRTWKDW